MFVALARAAVVPKREVLIRVGKKEKNAQEIQPALERVSQIKKQKPDTVWEQYRAQLAKLSYN